MGIIAVIIIVLVGGWILLSGTPASTPTPTTTTTTTVVPPATSPAANPAVNSAVTPVKPPAGTTSTTTTTTTTTTTSIANPANVTITYTNAGFTPATVTVRAGTRVTFVNQSTENMLVASAPHPTHQGYDGTTMTQHCAAGYTGPAPFDQCSAGSTFSFIFTKVGTWPYHNHASAGNRGTVIVTAALPI